MYLPLLILLSFWWATPAQPESPYVLLFKSSKSRADEGLSRQIARNKFAYQEFRRYSALLEHKAVSMEDYEMARAAAILAPLDLRIAEAKAQEAALALKIAETMSKVGRAVPICKRVKQSDENTASPLLKKLTTRPASSLPPLESNTSGTRVSLPNPEPPPPPPDPPPPIDPPDPLPPPDPPDPPDIDVPETPPPPSASTPETGLAKIYAFHYLIRWVGGSEVNLCVVT